jgi:hypothetical protein
MINLADWHKRLHEVSGAMALRFLTATPSDLIAWSWELHSIATAMARAAREAAAKPTSGAAAPEKVTAAAAPVADGKMSEAVRERLLQR